MTLDSQNRPAIRALTPAERRRFAVPGTGSDEPAPKPEHSLVVVAELDGQLLGSISAERVWCVSNFWVDARLRGSGTAEAMARAIAAMNTEGLAEMLVTTNRHVELLADRFGFAPVRGTLFRR